MLHVSRSEHEYVPRGYLNLHLSNILNVEHISYILFKKKHTGSAKGIYAIGNKYSTFGKIICYF